MRTGPAHVALSFLLMGLLVFSVVNQASALSPVSFDDQSTFTSLNADRWQTVWTDTTQTEIQLNGSSQYLTAGNNSIFDVSTGSFWLAGYFQDTSGASQRVIIGKKDSGSTSAGYVCVLGAAPRVLLCRIGDGTNTTINTNTLTVSVNTPYFFALVVNRDTNTMQVYLYNLATGTLASTSNSISLGVNSMTNSQIFTIGKQSFGAVELFQGPIDNVIPPQAGTISQAQFLEFATTGTITGVTPTSFYDFNEGAGTIAYDRIGTNDLTLHGSPTYTTNTLTHTLYTYFLDSLNGAYKIVKMNAISGTIQSQFTGQMRDMGSSSTVTSATGSSTQSSVFFSQNVGGTTQSLRTADVTFFSESIANNNSLLAGLVVNSATFSLKKTGSPTGNAVVAVFNSSCTTVYSLATLDVATLTTSFADYTFTSGTGRTLANGDRIGLFYNSGSVGNTLDIEYSNADRFDGTTNTITHTATGTQGSCSPTSQTARELKMSIGFEYLSEFANDNDGGVSYWQNNLDLTRATQSGFTTTTTLGDITTSGTKFVTEKIAGGVLSGTPVNTVDLTLSRSGTLTGTLYAGVFSGSGNTNRLNQATGTGQINTLNNANHLVAQHINAGSSLIGTTVNTLQIALTSAFSPVGMAYVCVFNNVAECIFEFGRFDVASIGTGTTTGYRFTNPFATHTIAQDDYIGVKYHGISVSQELRVRGATTDVLANSAKAFGTVYDLLHVSSGDVLLSGASGNDILGGERVGSTSILIGKQIDAMTLKLRKNNSSTVGTAYIGVWNGATTPTSSNAKQLFGTLDVSTLSDSVNAELAWSISPSSYTLASGDVFGVLFPSNGVSGRSLVVQRASDAFNGSGTASVWSSFHATGGWANSGGNELVAKLNILNPWHADTTTDLGNSGTNNAFILDDTSITANYLFGSMDASTLTTSPAVYRFTNSTAPHTISATQYVGVFFQSETSGQNVQVHRTAVDSFDGTSNAVLSTRAVAGSSWSDQTAQDIAFNLLHLNATSQESGAFIKYDAGSAQSVSALRVFWPDMNKIPASVTLATSTNDSAWTDRGTVSPNQAVGWDVLNLDGTYSVRYVRMTVASWGAADSMAVGEFQRFTTITSSNPSALSAVEVVGGVPRVYFAQQVSTTQLLHGIIHLNTGQVIDGQVSALTTTQAISGAPIAVQQTKNAVYYIVQGASAAGNLGFYYSNRDLSSLTSINTAYSGLGATHLVDLEVVTNGATRASDVLYFFDGRGAASIPRMGKLTDAAASNLGNIGSTSATQSGLQLTNLGDKILVRLVQSGQTKIFTVTKATDAISGQLFFESWTTWTTQQHDFDGTTFTFKPGSKAYFATYNSPKAMSYSSAGVLNRYEPFFVEVVDPLSHYIDGISATFYHISDSLIVQGAGTTWTPRLVAGPTVTINPTLYREDPYVPLIQDSEIYTNGVIHLVCDANYGINHPMIVGDDADCTMWRVLDGSTSSPGRTLSYSRTASLVHADPYSHYLFLLSTQNPGNYGAKIIYDGRVVDQGNFDSMGSLELKLLFGNCYTVDLENTVTGQLVTLNLTCANNINPKTINLLSLNFPENWLGTNWRYSVQRIFNETSMQSTVQLDVTYSVRPFNATIVVTDHFIPAHQTFRTFYNYTNVEGVITLPLVMNNTQTIYFIVYDADNVPRVSINSSGKVFNIVNPVPIDGSIFGISTMAFFVLIAAGISVKTDSPYHIIVIGLLVGLLYTWNLLPELTDNDLSMLIVLAALGMVYIVKRLW